VNKPSERDPWKIVKKAIDKHDKEMCDAWNGELDTILTFVCFSCVPICIKLMIW